MPRGNYLLMPILTFKWKVNNYISDETTSVYAP